MQRYPSDAMMSEVPDDWTGITELLYCTMAVLANVLAAAS